MARIRYLAFVSDDPAALAGFYQSNFGMNELGRTPAGDITLTDGGYNITIFKMRKDLHELRMQNGLHHIGIAVDDIDAVVKRYLERYPRGVVVKEAADLQHGEVRIHDPETHPVTLCQRNFGLTSSEQRVPRIAHLAMNALDPEAVRDFYKSVFGFRELFEAHKERFKDPNYKNRHIGDGFSNMAIQTFYSGGEEGHEARFGIAHIGFLVPDSKAQAELVTRNGATVAARPARRKQSEARMRDPQGNGADLSQRGWEVDTDMWARAAA